MMIQVQNKKISTDTAVQTEDSDLFYTCYDYVEAQRQENLFTSEVLDETVDTFQDLLQDITDRLDKNFQFLTVQLRAEFDSYLQYALGISTGEYLLRHNLENTSTPRLPYHSRFSYLILPAYNPIWKLWNKLANEDIQHQAEGDRPLDKNRPWLHKSFGT